MGPFPPIIMLGQPFENIFKNENIDDKNLNEN